VAAGELDRFYLQLIADFSGRILVRRTYRMSIESDIVERVNRAASKKQIPISDTKQK